MVVLFRKVCNISYGGSRGPISSPETSRLASRVLLGDHDEYAPGGTVKSRLFLLAIVLLAASINPTQGFEPSSRGECPAVSHKNFLFTNFIIFFHRFL